MACDRLKILTLEFDTEIERIILFRRWIVSVYYDDSLCLFRLLSHSLSLVLPLAFSRPLIDISMHDLLFSKSLIIRLIYWSSSFLVY